MLCSECSKPIRPIVAVDIDGTLGDYHGHFIRFAEKYLGRRLPWDYDATIPFNEALRMEKSLYREIKLAYRQGGMKRSMAPYPHAADFVRSLRDSGAEVWLTTTRPYLRYDRIDPDTRHWLDRQGIEYDGLVYDEGKYQRLVDLVDKNRIVGVLEDLPELWVEAEEMGLHPIYRINAYNGGIIHRPSINSLMEAAAIFHRLIIDWKRINETRPITGSGVPES